MLVFYGRESLVPLSTLKLEDYPLSAVLDFLFSRLYLSLPYVYGDFSCISNLRTLLAVVISNQLHAELYYDKIQISITYLRV
jgi:hypothetical protein